MRRNFLFLLIVFVMCAGACNREASAPHFIFDTDLGGDIDDVLALEMLVNYHKAGEIVLDGVILSKSNPLAVRFADGYLRWHGLGDEIPLGWVYEGKSPEDFYYMIPTLEAEYDGHSLLEPAQDILERVPEGYKLMRKILASSPDASVNIVSVGMYTNLQRLLESEPDEFSPLAGEDLVRRKVASLHLMGGVFAGEPFPESNVVTDLEASKVVLGTWPGRITASGFEVGDALRYPHESVENDFGEPGSHPLNVAYTHWGAMPYDRPSWDLTSVFEAVEGCGNIFEYSPYGTIRVDDAGCVSFEASGSGEHRYLILPQEKVVEARSALVSVVSGRRFSECRNASGKFDLCRVDPLCKVVPGDRSFCETDDTICVARGENATVQIVMTNTSTDTIHNPSIRVRCKVGTSKTAWVHNVVCSNVPYGADDLLVSSDRTYPDPLFDDAEEIIPPGQRGTIWVDIAVPRDAEEGLYESSVVVVANGERKSRPFVIKVYPVTLPQRQSLTVVQWYHEKSLMWMNGGEPVERFSPEYYEYLQTIAQTAAEYGQNCWLIMSQPEIVGRQDGNGFDLDFSEFDRTVEMLIEHGGLRMMNCGHFGSRLPDSAWSDAFVFSGFEWKDGKAEPFTAAADDPRLEAYINSYFPAVEQHLREKGWLGMYYQHIADEPDVTGTASHESWIKVARMIKAAAPGIRLMDASFDILECQDITVPILGYSIAQYRGAPEGGERWMYTCTTPQGNFANRFIHQPLLKPRLVHWVNYKYNTTGYLHWGLNWWEGCDDPVHDTTPHTHWPCGDCYIIYPGDGKVYPSIRLCAMRDGIRDFELLHMAEEKDPARARDFCDAVVSGPDTYMEDIAAFRDLRRSLLEFLSK